MLKVSKSQKHFFLKFHCPKNEWNIRQNSALWSWGRILSNILFVFWAMEFQEKYALEIYWPLDSLHNLAVQHYPIINYLDWNPDVNASHTKLVIGVKTLSTRLLSYPKIISITDHSLISSVKEYAIQKPEMFIVVMMIGQRIRKLKIWRIVTAKR